VIVRSRCGGEAHQLQGDFLVDALLFGDWQEIAAHGYAHRDEALDEHRAFGVELGSVGLNLAVLLLARQAGVECLAHMRRERLAWRLRTSGRTSSRC
jgi:hypothetical protein